ncbi:MAG: murB [Parcubacteria group bacterium]|nr:murB [Parcubacteria group bacterium]
MRVKEHVPLAEHTTFRIGGPVTLFVTAETIKEVKEAYELAHSRGLDAYPLGQGSNVLAGDASITKAVITLAANAITYLPGGTDEEVYVHAEGGVSWDALVSDVVAQGLWGIENLAGIPGTVGAAPVQNIGAYGVEVQDSVVQVNAYDPIGKVYVQFEKKECGFAYRDSRFKQEPRYFITGVTFALSKVPNPRLSYKDIEARREAGSKLGTSADIAREIRDIRSYKFPTLSEFGTAGSFFKNPVITPEHYGELHAAYPELPGFESAAGIKIPLAWILDHVLQLRGFVLGPVSLFQTQPLVMVAEQGAHAHDVNALAELVSTRVHDATNIFIEREVQSLV